MPVFTICTFNIIIISIVVIDVVAVILELAVFCNVIAPLAEVHLILKIETFVVDIKSMDTNIYRDYTGVELEVALNNLVSLIKLVETDRIIVRVPVIHGYADEKSQALSIKKLNNLGITQIDSFTYKTK